MRDLNGGYARAYNKRYGGDAHVFRNRFGARLVERDEHLLAAARYIVLNPVRAGICAAPEDWPWSSYRATAGLAPRPPYLSLDLLFELLDPQPDLACVRYREFVGVSDTVTKL
jgi:hypothetical protein